MSHAIKYDIIEICGILLYYTLIVPRDMTQQK